MRLPLLALVATLLASTAAQADPVSVLFVGNSYTFGRSDPVMGYNAANVNDLTAPMWADNPAGSNAFEPHPWGGVPGIFQRLTVQAGLDYEVAMSARNAASLRGHLLNSNGAGWDLRGNLGAQVWDQVVLQEQSDEVLLRRPGLGSNPEYTQLYADLMENWVHDGAALNYRERNFIGGNQAGCTAIGLSSGSCSAQRSLPENPNASALTQLYLYQTWARPNLIDGALVTQTDGSTGAVTRTATPADTFFSSLEAMTAELAAGYAGVAAHAALDGSGGFAGIAPVGEAFLRAVTDGLATRDLWASDAATDGLIDLWFDDGTHASVYGSYLSALTLFGTLTGLDPAMFGDAELAAFELGISAADAVALQRVASAQLGHAVAVPEPSAIALSLLSLGLIGWVRRGRSGTSLQA